MLQKHQIRKLHTCSSAITTRRSVVVSAAKDTKQPKRGFGAVKQEKVVKDGCPCGSGKYYKECCKPRHTGAEIASTVEETVRARFSAILKKDVSYLLKTTHPDFHSFMYGTEPGAALRTLQDDLWNTCDHYEYSNLKIYSVQPGDQPDEQLAVFQYTVYDKRTPLIDEQGNKVRKVQVEQSRFKQEAVGKLWLFADCKVVEVPEALAKVAELQAKDMAASQQAQRQQAQGHQQDASGQQ
eukprot:gene7010-7224_t